MNSSFLFDRAGRFVLRLEPKAGADPAHQVPLAWPLAFSRLRSAAERSDATAFLAAQASHLRAKGPPAEPTRPDAKAKPAPPSPWPPANTEHLPLKRPQGLVCDSGDEASDSRVT